MSAGTGDLTAESKVVSDWADTNCSGSTQQAGATPSDATSTPSDVTSTPSDVTSTTASDDSGDNGAATPDLAGFCPVVWDVTQKLATWTPTRQGAAWTGRCRPLPTGNMPGRR